MSVASPGISFKIADEVNDYLGIQGKAFHEDRHDKKLSTVIAWHRNHLDDFRKRFWEYYDPLLAYCQDPTPYERQCLEREFDRLG